MVIIQVQKLLWFGMDEKIPYSQNQYQVDKTRLNGF